MKHTLNGNCWSKRVVYRAGEINDVCNEHDEPRGECSVCLPCLQCQGMTFETFAQMEEGQNE